MVTSRYECGSAVLNGCIYLAGGHSGFEYLSSVECFDPRTEQGNDVRAMNSRRSGVCDCFIFILLTLLMFSWVSQCSMNSWLQWAVMMEATV